MLFALERHDERRGNRPLLLPSAQILLELFRITRMGNIDIKGSED